MSSSDRAMLNAFKEISTMADRINLPRNIVVGCGSNRNNLYQFISLDKVIDQLILKSEEPK